MALSVKLDDAMKERIQALASERQRSPHWIMREAIRQYVESEEAKSTFEKEAMAAWRHYKETGLHLTGEEVQIWLESWGTDDETDAPECHD
jgi:predicted transcriptional regulator